MDGSSLGRIQRTSAQCGGGKKTEKSSWFQRRKSASSSAISFRPQMNGRLQSCPGEAHRQIHREPKSGKYRPRFPLRNLDDGKLPLLPALRPGLPVAAAGRCFSAHVHWLNPAIVHGT